MCLVVELSVFGNSFAPAKGVKLPQVSLFLPPTIPQFQNHLAQEGGGRETDVQKCVK